MDDNLLDALVDAFGDSDEDERREDARRSSVSTMAEKSMFYKSALDDQTWLHADSGDEESNGGRGMPDMSDATPTGQSEKEKKQLTLSALEREMHESYAQLPSAGETSSELQLSSGDLDEEMEQLKKRLQELEEEKKRRCQTMEEKRVAERKVEEPVQKIRECPIDFTQPRSLIGIDAEGGESVVERNASDDDENAAATEERLSRKRKSETHDSGNSKSRRSALTSADSPATAALREKCKDICSKLDHKDHRFCTLAPYDPYFGIRVQTPKVSSVTFQNYVGIRQKVRVSELTADSSIKWDDWVTMGVVVDKTPLKTAASGCQFTIWKLSDLIDCQRVVRLLLFGDSAKALWKVNKGDVVALLNAAKMDNKPDGFLAEKTNVVTLKLDNKQKIVELGICPDYGVCRGTRKQDNMHCANFVNKSKSDYCDFHLLAASKRLAAKRGEFQLGSNVPPKKFNNPIKKVLPGGNIRTSRLPIKSGVAMALDLTRRPVGGVATARKTTAQTGTDETTEGSSSAESKESVQSSQLQEALRSNTVGSRQIFGQLAKNGKDGVQSKSSLSQLSLARPKLTCRQFLAGQITGGTSQSVRLAKGEEAKAKAIFILRARSAISKPEPEVANPKNTNSSMHPGADAGNSTKLLAKRPRLLGQISNLNKEQLKQLAEKKSLREGGLTEEDAQRQEEYFKIMEAKEKVDQRATEVMSLKGCKVVTCRTCKYTWHAQSALCKQNSHVVRWHTAEKRFFKCRTCGTRTVAYDKYPNKPCQCGATTFVRVAMRQESKGPRLVGETLKVRGDEERFANC